jgi:galactokinase
MPRADAGPASLATRVQQAFADRFGAPPDGVAFAPGRVNLIGEHTDYNDGFVLPMALDRGVAVAFRARADRRLRVHASAFGETREVGLDGLAPLSVHGNGHGAWMPYVAGVGWALETAGHRVPGLDVVVEADLPMGAGLSSSAALEVAMARAWCEAGGLSWRPAEMARLCQKAENEFAGMACGLMDQFAAAASEDGCALLLDCRSLATEPVPLPASAVVVVMDTGVRRSLAASSAYNDRRSACEAAVATLRAGDRRVHALRDVDLPLLVSARADLDPVAFRCARHVVEENQRPPAMAEALRRGDLREAGRLMDASHASLRDLFQVSSPHLDLISDVARRHPRCYGARMTGAGFGGCAVALVEAAHAAAFAADVERDYRAAAEPNPAFFVCRPSGGARLLDGAATPAGA